MVDMCVRDGRSIPLQVLLDQVITNLTAAYVNNVTCAANLLQMEMIIVTLIDSDD